MDEYFVYIDEAGDEGFGKLASTNKGGQSNWLLLGGIVVSRENDCHLPQWRDEIMDAFPFKRRRDLHFNKLRHEQRVAACRMLSTKRFGACVVGSDKTTIPELRPDLLKIYKSKGHLYNYLVRYLLERLTSACVDKSNGRNCRITVTFSKRGGTDYEVMRDYLFLMRDGKEVIRPVRSIDWTALHPEDVKVEDHSNRAGLQLADVVTSATYAALEENMYGDNETRYASLLRSRYIRTKDKRLRNCGLTIVPSTSFSKPNVRHLLEILE